MRKPDLDRVVETFVRISGLPHNPVAAWQAYLELLRRDIAPLVHRLQSEGKVDWFSFLVHDRTSGVPTSPDDGDAFVHLRLELDPSCEERKLINELPDWCLMTRSMGVPDPPALDAVLVDTLQDGDVREGWRVLGESSEWVFSMLEAHDTTTLTIPQQNVAQFLHYLGNQAQLSMVGIPAP